MDNLDKFLSAGATLNPFRPLHSLWCDFTRGPHTRFSIDAYQGWSVNDIKQLLRRNHIQFWGAGFFDGVISFTVPDYYRGRTIEILHNNGLTNE